MPKEIDDKPPLDSPHHSLPSSKEEVRGFSYPYMAVWSIQIILVLVAANAHKTWLILGTNAIYLALILVGLQQAISKKVYKAVSSRIPNRTTWVLNWLIFFVILPLALWVFLGLPSLARVF